jgi:transposase-like protein
MPSARCIDSERCAGKWYQCRDANLLRRWVAEWGDGGRPREEQSEPAALTHKPEFVRLASEVREMAAAHAKIELVLERGEYRVLASGSSTVCAAFVRALLA